MEIGRETRLQGMEVDREGDWTARKRRRQGGRLDSKEGRKTGRETGPQRREGDREGDWTPRKGGRQEGARIAILQIVPVIQTVVEDNFNYFNFLSQKAHPNKPPSSQADLLLHRFHVFCLNAPCSCCICYTLCQRVP